MKCLQRRRARGLNASGIHRLYAQAPLIAKQLYLVSYIRGFHYRFQLPNSAPNVFFPILHLAAARLKILTFLQKWNRDVVRLMTIP